MKLQLQTRVIKQQKIN